MNHQKNETKAVVFLLFASVLILVFLFWWIYGKQPVEVQSSWVNLLPFLNALMNSLTAVFLIFSFRAIKRKNIILHRNLIFSALGASAIFLISYLLYHHYHGDTKFLREEPLIRYTYFTILISHILLSIVQIPCILLTLYYAFSGNVIKHKMFAKFTFPIWLYVSVTGVLVFYFVNYLNK